MTDDHQVSAFFDAAPAGPARTIVNRPRFGMGERWSRDVARAFVSGLELAVFMARGSGKPRLAHRSIFVDLHRVEAVPAKRCRNAPCAATHPGRSSYRFRWQDGQKWLERFANFSRTIAVPQRLHGCPERP